MEEGQPQDSTVLRVAKGGGIALLAVVMVIAAWWVGNHFISVTATPYNSPSVTFDDEDGTGGGESEDAHPVATAEEAKAYFEQTRASRQPTWIVEQKEDSLLTPGTEPYTYACSDNGKASGDPIDRLDGDAVIGFFLPCLVNGQIVVATAGFGIKVFDHAVTVVNGQLNDPSPLPTS